jgi:hypothetical protein
MERLSRLHGEGEGGMKSRSLRNYGNSRGTESLDSAMKPSVGHGHPQAAYSAGAVSGPKTFCNCENIALVDTKKCFYWGNGEND